MPYDTRPTLFAFHHAGGSTATFSGWRRQLGTSWRLEPVRLPDRGARTQLADLVGELDAALTGPRPRAPHAFYGHSMGALIAYALTLRRMTAGAALPVRLIVGAFPAPHLPLPAPLTARTLTDSELVGGFLDGGELPPALLTDRTLLRRRADAIGRDLRLCRTYRHVPGTTLPVPIDVFIGADDPLVRLSAARAWALHSTRGADIHVVNGGHFFPRQSRDAFFNRLRELLDASLRQGG